MTRCYNSGDTVLPTPYPLTNLTKEVSSMAARIVVRPGERFNRLTFVKDLPSCRGPGGTSYRVARFLCDCGSLVERRLSDVRNGMTGSCGCFRKEVTSKLNKDQAIHGMSGTRTYRIWVDIRRRCNNPKIRGYKNYGGRGITVCERWESFDNFLSDMGEIPFDGATIDRIDNDGPYCPENCRWTTNTENQRNRRNSKWWYVNGRKFPSCSSASKATGIPMSRIYYWSSIGKNGFHSEPKYVDEVVT